MKFLLLVGLSLSALAAFGEGVRLTAGQRARLDRALREHHTNYNPATHMLVGPVKSPGYHTTIKTGLVHSTRGALVYAVALLDTGDEALCLRAQDILRAVLALQDTNPASRTYGIWPWFLEEPLEKMAPPDWNWADFCGVQLLQVALDHRGRIDPELAAKIEDAIRHAARSIQRRNVGPGYTNIALMGTYVTYVAAELYGLDDLKAYAADRLRQFHAYTMEQGAFSEYNSPTYSMVALAEVQRMRLHIRDPAARPLLDQLHRMLWEDIAWHFHAPTRQWAGPHSRCYNTLLGDTVLTTLQRASGGRLDIGVDAPDLSAQRLPMECPADLLSFFQSLEKPRAVVRTYQKGDRPVIGTTWLEPAFALGSINRGDLWNQRRALIGYFGTADKPSYLHVRLLRNGYDLATAQFFSAQTKGDVLAAINFATDGGNTHVSLDRIQDGRFTAERLSLRFELGGEAGRARPAVPARIDEPARLRFGDTRIAIAVPHCTFGDAKPRWESGVSTNVAWLEVVLYDGAEKTIDLKALDSAAIGLAVRMSAVDADPPVVQAAVADGNIALTWDTLRVRIPTRPAPASALRSAVSL